MSVTKTNRDRLLVEAHHRCTICLETCFEVHHIVEKADGGSDDPENLIVLCPNCHQHRIHRSREITRDQLYLYKQRLSVRTQMLKRLLLNVADVRARVAGAIEQEEAPLRSLAVDAILDEMIGNRDPSNVFEIPVPEWVSSFSINGVPAASEVYARLYELDDPNPTFVAVLIEKVSEDLSKLDQATLRRITQGRHFLYTDDVVLDCLGPFRSSEEAKAHALAWRPAE